MEKCGSKPKSRRFSVGLCVTNFLLMAVTVLSPPTMGLHNKNPAAD